MDDLREKVIKGLECCAVKNITPESARHCGICPYDREINGEMDFDCQNYLLCNALELLKAQELPPVKPEKLEEVTTKWLDEMTAKERLEKIAMILDDWDGYRTAKGLAGLINEVWAYALYPVKEQESFQPFRSGIYHPDWCCGNCKYPGLYGRMKFCPECGKAVKWDADD
jgi:hypothetical protein